MTDIDLKLLPDFIVESADHLDELEALLLQLLKNPQDLSLLNEVFRPVHTLKGSAQFIGVSKAAKLAHRMEDLLDMLRDGRKSCSDKIVSLLIEAKDRIVQLVSELEKSQSEVSLIDDLIESLNSCIVSDDASGEDINVSGNGTPSSSLLVNDGFNEEPDQELFEIFSTHQSQQLEDLKACNQRLNQREDKLKALEECYGILKSLRSSANYMSYNRLAELYQEWLDEIFESQVLIKNGDTADLYFMDLYFMELEPLLPSKFSQNIVVNHAGTTESFDAKPSIEDDFEMPDLDELQAAVFGCGFEPEQTDNATGVENDLETDLSMLPEFVVETTEHLDELEVLLLVLNNKPWDINTLNEIFRPVHTIKGSAQFIGLARMAELSHRMEDLLDLLRDGRKVCTTEIVNLLMLSRDRMLSLVAELDTDQRENSAIDDLIEKLNHSIDADGSVTTDSGSLNDQSAIENKQPKSGFYNEEYDKELFEIFINHLHDQLLLLKVLQREINDKLDQSVVLDECVKILSNLKSSANYMNYEKLVNIYNGIINDISSQITGIQEGKSVSLECLDLFFNDMSDEVPQLEIFISGEESYVNEIGVTKQISIAVESGSDVDSDVPGVDDMLYARLTDALNGSSHQVSKSEYETLHQVYDAMVSPNKKTEVEITGVGHVGSMARNNKRGLMRRNILERRPDKERRESKVKRSLRVDSSKIDSLMNQVGELVVDRSYFHQLFTELNQLQQSLKTNTNIDQKEIKAIRAFSYRFGEAISSLSRTSNELQEEVMKMRMLPISQIFNRYPRLIHDLTHNSDKKVNLVIRGGDTELDKMIVEEISDPLIHIIRNAVDHGIESIDKRYECGKQDEGTLILEAYQESNHIVIEVTDDGRGIDHDKIKNKALEKGLYTPDQLERMNIKELNQLILVAGFSTADKITDTSGRGVGMDVVKQNIEKLNGVLEIESKLGFGTRMRLKIPLTLAIIHALMVKVGKEMFTIPLANVDETVRIKEGDISTIEGVEVFYLRNQSLPIFRLSKLFSVAVENTNENVSLVIVNRNGQRTGFVVDELLGQEEVVIKPLADYVQHKSGFSGATIIGDGRISLILDVYELVRMAQLNQKDKQERQARHLKSKFNRKSHIDVNKQLQE